MNAPPIWFVKLYLIACVIAAGWLAVQVTIWQLTKADRDLPLAIGLSLLTFTCVFIFGLILFKL